MKTTCLAAALLSVLAGCNTTSAPRSTPNGPLASAEHAAGLHVTPTPHAAAPVTARATARMTAPATAQQAEPQAEQTYGPGRRDLLFTLSGAWSKQTFQLNDAEQTTTQATVGLSYFLSRAHELGLSLGIQSLENESSFVNGGMVETVRTKGETIFVNALYNYNLYVGPRTGLYLGPQVGWGRFDSGVTDTSEPQYGVHLGLRQWIHPRIALTIEPQYYFVSFDDDQGGESDVYQILFGLAARL